MCLTTIYDEIPLSLRRPTNGFGVFREDKDGLYSEFKGSGKRLPVGVWLNEIDYMEDCGNICQKNIGLVQMILMIGMKMIKETP